MLRSHHVVIMEDDLYSRDFMSMLLMRDWRTRVIADVSNEKELRTLLETRKEKIDLILLDTEAPHHRDWLLNTAKLIKHSDQNCLILCTGTIPHVSLLKEIVSLGCHGYVMKKEVRYGLAAAVRYTVAGKWVTTPSVRQIAHKSGFRLPDETMVLESYVNLDSLTPREREMAKLAILFNLSQHDLHDELLISEGQVARHVHSAYKKMGLHDILDSESLPEDFFESELVISQFKSGQEQRKKRNRVENMSTFGFHLLTLVEDC